ncbi:MAG: metallophosphoesterase [Endozoicomonas sp.]
MFFKAFGPNREGRDYAIGDLHGMYDLLFQELEKADFDFARDRCFSVGDLIDRGPDSEKCLSLINEPWFHPVLGNHEDTLRSVARAPSSAVLADWVLNGGRWHLQVSSAKMLEYADLVDSLPGIIEIETAGGKRIGLCHAEYPLDHWAPGRVEQDDWLRQVIMWSRNRIRIQDDSTVVGIDHILCGHTIVEEPVTLGNSHFIDTGAFATNKLTLLPLDSL